MGCERAGGGGLRWLWVDERERERMIGLVLIFWASYV